MKHATIILVTLSVLLTLASVLWAASDQRRDVRTCEEQCQRQQPYFEEHLCSKRCQEQGGMSVANEDDAKLEYEECQFKCSGSGKKQWQCQRKCRAEYETALERERGRKHEHESEHEHEGEHHGGRGKRSQGEHDYTHCLHKCDDREEGLTRQRQCKLQCEDKFGRHKEERRHHRQDIHGENDNSHKTKKEKSNDNPFYLDSQSFESRYSTGQGQMKVLKRFSDKSDLLLGIDKFRVGFFEAKPNSFMLPHHWDADSLLFIIKGKATMTLLKQENRETFNLERGDVVMIPAGTTAYLVSTHSHEKLQIAELLRPINTPGHYEQFFGVGGGKSQSFLDSFSTEILQAALNIPKDELEKLLNKQKEGSIIKASQEQVRGLSHGMSRKQFGSSRGLFNMLNERPQMSNEHGEFYEVTPDNYQVLEDLDVSVAYCDIKQGSMMAPNYNSRTTYIVLVEEGSGSFEIASPQSNKKQQGSSETYKKVGSRLSKGDVFVIPAGHPVALIASEKESLRTIGFGINAQNNQRYFLAGQDNIINMLDEEAMELSFNLPAKEVEKMFQKQKQSYFMAGPRRQQNALLSLLDFAGF